MKRYISLFIISAFCAGIVSGCSGTGSSGQAARTPEYVSADSLWYDSERVELVDMTGCTGWGSRGGTVDGLIYTDGDVFLIDEDLCYGNDPEDEVYRLELIDRTGSVLLSIDHEPMDDEGMHTDIFFMNRGQLWCLSELIDMSGDLSYSIYSIDLETGEEQNRTELPELTSLLGYEYSFGCVEATDGLARIAATSWSGGVTFIDIDEDLSISSTDISQQLADAGMDCTYSVFKCSDTKYLITGSDLFGDEVAVIYDSETGEAAQISNTILSHNLRSTGDSITYTDSYGVYEFDPDTQDFTQILDYNDCNVNRYDIPSMTPVYVEDGRIILWGVLESPHRSMSIYDLTRTETNPNEGKMILLLASLQDGIDSTTAEAIFRFNQTSQTAVIRLDNRYDTMGFTEQMYHDYNDSVFTDEFARQFMGEYASVSDRLAIDILAGEGPDIILNGYSFPQLESSGCLADLSGRIATLDQSAFFTPVLSDSDYHIPFSICLTAICYNPDHADEDFGLSPDYEQYSRFVDTVCNGSDPILQENGRVQYFLLLFENMYDAFEDSNGNLNLDNEEFRELAEYCRDLPEDCSMYSGDFCINSHLNENCSWGDLTYGQSAIMGLPSSNGTTPRLSVNASAAVAGTCPDIDAAWEFIQMLLSDDAQQCGWGDGTMSVNRQICENAIRDSIRRNNEEAENFTPSYQWDEGPDPISDEVADTYLNALQNAMPSVYADPDILIVLSEEIQAYFAGDKTIDEVIPLMQDRCNTVLGERAT